MGKNNPRKNFWRDSVKWSRGERDGHRSFFYTACQDVARRTALGKRNGKRAWSVMDRNLQDSVRNNAKQEEDERRIMSTPPDPNRPHPMMEKPMGKKTI